MERRYPGGVSKQAGSLRSQDPPSVLIAEHGRFRMRSQDPPSVLIAEHGRFRMRSQYPLAELIATQ